MQWKHDRPKQYLPKLCKMLGRPDVFCKQPYGVAIWRGRGNALFKEHILRDEDVRHCKPKPHHDFFYSAVTFYVPPSKRLQIMKLSGSVQYDGLKKMLIARCGSIEANIATLYLVMAIASNHMSIDRIKKQHLYAQHIQGKAMSYDAMKKEMNRMKRRNQRTHRQSLQLNRDPFAFKTC